ncbi:MAG: beta-ketoacyl-[acyl-carrier-protein] synthase family protein, partial [SAR324 cluster bacterium]|nr:beta-ketoacyl-[acyl-carrier-protein] synthase family protein [SAR324 cluster bacterium]
MTVRVFVTGMGLISAIGSNIAECMESIANQHSGLGEITVIETRNKGIFPVCEVKRTDQQLKKMAGMDSKKIVSRTLLLGFIAAREALKMAAFPAETLLECGLISANSVGGMDRTENFYAEYLKNEKA